MFRLLTGKLVTVIDESLQYYTELQQVPYRYSYRINDDKHRSNMEVGGSGCSGCSPASLSPSLTRASSTTRNYNKCPTVPFRFSYRINADKHMLKVVCNEKRGGAEKVANIRKRSRTAAMGGLFVVQFHSRHSKPKLIGDVLMSRQNAATRYLHSFSSFCNEHCLLTHRIILRQYATFPTPLDSHYRLLLNMEVDLQSLFGLHVM